MVSGSSSSSSNSPQTDSVKSDKQHQNDLLKVKSKPEIEQVTKEVSIVEKVDISNGDKTAVLPRADGGKDAWLFLAGCFVFEALVWGFPFSFGVFQDYYTTHPPFSEHPSGIAAIGTCSTGVMYLFAPVSLYVLEAWPSVRKLSSVFGLIIVLASLIGSSFSTQVWHLILTQGILYAIGGSFLYAPTMFYLDEWFIRKKGLAFGIMWAGVGTGYATTLRIWSLILLILCAPLIHFVRARLPIPSPPPPRQTPNFSFLTTPTFIFLQASNILESLGFFMPAIYLPTYARSLGLGETSGQVLLALLNSFSVLGAIALGHLCDTLPVNLVISISTLGAIISIFLFWGLGTNVGMLVVFAMGYGFFAGGYSAIWAGMMKDVKRVSPKAGMGTLMGLFAAGRGVGSVVSGPVSEVLMRYGPIGGAGSFGYGTKFGVLIVFTGVSALSGLVCLGSGFGGSRKEKSENDVEVTSGSAVESRSDEKSVGQIVV